MNITVKVNDNITIECECIIEGDQWAVGAGEFGRMPYALGATIPRAVENYIHKLQHATPPKPIAVPQPLIPSHMPIIPPRQAAQSPDGEYINFALR